MLIHRVFGKCVGGGGERREAFALINAKASSHYEASWLDCLFLEDLGQRRVFILHRRIYTIFFLLEGSGRDREVSFFKKKNRPKFGSVFCVCVRAGLFFFSFSQKEKGQ